MGVFDSFLLRPPVRCPQCGAPDDVAQSKDLGCLLRRFQPGDSLEAYIREYPPYYYPSLRSYHETGDFDVLGSCLCEDCYHYWEVVLPVRQFVYLGEVHPYQPIPAEQFLSKPHNVQALRELVLERFPDAQVQESVQDGRVRSLTVSLVSPPMTDVKAFMDWDRRMHDLWRLVMYRWSVAEDVLVFQARTTSR